MGEIMNSPKGVKSGVPERVSIPRHVHLDRGGTCRTESCCIVIDISIHICLTLFVHQAACIGVAICDTMHWKGYIHGKPEEIDNTLCNLEQFSGIFVGNRARWALPKKIQLNLL